MSGGGGRGPVYTILFILVLSAVFAAALAGANALYRPRIEANRELAEKRDLLYVFGMDTGGTPGEVAARFDASVRKDTLGDLEVYARLDGAGVVEAYAVPFVGAGLWGTIRGYLGVSQDLQAVRGVVFTSHSETPGLGGRIDELAYKEQFRGLSLAGGARLAYGEGDLDAITGATSTSNAVLRILNDLVENTLSGLEVSP